MAIILFYIAPSQVHYLFKSAEHTIKDTIKIILFIHKIRLYIATCSLILTCIFFREISDTLEEGWQLPEPQRKKIIKRLLLKWHPDKNIGNEEFCTRVVHFIQAEIERLEQGIPRYDPSFTANFEVSTLTKPFPTHFCG